MSRSFNHDTNNRLIYAGTPIPWGSRVGWTIACWVKFNSVAHTEQTLVRIGTAPANNDHMIALLTFGSEMRAYRAENFSYTSSGKTGLTAGVWYHIAGVFLVNVALVYVNGVPGTLDTNTKNFTAIAGGSTSVGVYVQWDGTYASPLDGEIAEVAVWDVDLYDPEIAAMADGLSYKRIRPGSIRAYWTLNSGTDGEPNQATNPAYALTKAGTVGQSSHPPAVSDFVNDGTLAVLVRNQRHFTVDGVTGLLLAGGHTWNTLIDYSNAGFPPPASPSFDWQAYIDECATAGHNFMRFWVFDHSHLTNLFAANDYFGPLPYARTGPGNALDGGLKFDLTTYDSDYFDRLRARIQYAASKGMFVSVMFFEALTAWSGNAWRLNGHPYASANNINSVNADLNSDSYAKEVYEWTQDSSLTTPQRAYIRKVIDTVHDLPNVIYEIANEGESSAASAFWQTATAQYIRLYERTKPATYRHMIWRSPAGSLDDKTLVLTSQGDIVSPGSAWTGYGSFATPALGLDDQPYIYESDHLGAADVTVSAFWRAFLRGHHLSYMDDPSDMWSLGGFSTSRTLIRDNLGWIRRCASQMTLENCAPNGALSSTGYCLANPGVEYIVYQPSSGAFTVDLSASGQTYTVEWIETTTGSRAYSNVVGGSASHVLTPPFGSAGIAAILTAYTAPITRVRRSRRR